MAKIIEVKPHGDSFLYSAGTRCIWNTVKVFLAGTIDMGDSKDWQKEMVEDMKTWAGDEITFVVANPRRDEGFGDDPHELDYQIDWELNHLESADLIVMYLAGNSKSPISLMELGLFAKTGLLYVICEPEFYRYENVRKVCERYNVPLFNTTEEFKNYSYGQNNEPWA